MGGRIFNGICEPISADIAIYIQQAIIDEIHDIYPNITIIPVGSVGKKSDFNSDIDIAIICKDINQLRDIIMSVFDYTESITMESLYIISIKYPYKIENKIKYVQCDFINVWDIEYTKFRYYCPNYINNESKYKVGQKIMFATMVINHCNDLKQQNCNTNQYGKYLFTPTGLFHRIYDIDKMIYTDTFVTTNVQEIVSMCFNDNDASHFNSIETLWEAIHSDKYKYPEEVKSLEKNFFVNCWRKGWENIVPEDFELQYWSNEEIWELINKQSKINKINNIFCKLANMENK